jgi:hypothetical protein
MSSADGRTVPVEILKLAAVIAARVDDRRERGYREAAEAQGAGLARFTHSARMGRVASVPLR